jgi:hypothetical protein
MPKRVYIGVDFADATKALMFLDNLQRTDCDNDNVYRALLIIKDKIRKGMEDA